MDGHGLQPKIEVGRSGMCGIFGLVQKETGPETGKIFRELFLLSESRGKEASGFGILRHGRMEIGKAPTPASVFVKSRVFKDMAAGFDERGSGPFVGIGHARLVTNGYEHFERNNQPVVKDGMVAVHNGIIVNQTELWRSYGEENRISDLDSELIPTIVGRKIGTGQGVGAAIGSFFREMRGTANFALHSARFDNLFLATNNGSIYYVNDGADGLFIFTSERNILRRLIEKRKLKASPDSIAHLNAGRLLSIDLSSVASVEIGIGEEPGNLRAKSGTGEVLLLTDKKSESAWVVNTSLEHRVGEVSRRFTDGYLQRKEKIDGMKRCTRCILPSTFPFIEFDANGVCNYCNNYRPVELLGKAALNKIAEASRRKDGGSECLVPFSGGRDSSYALHYIVREMGLKPMAYSYDWGMLTDLARRNQARLCGSLGVEHILISADIRKKRDNIRKNILAWLRRPDLGTVPLFMAGDKQYLHYANVLMKQNGLNLSILGENLLEKTGFKSGFCGVRPNFQNRNTYQLAAPDKLKMAVYYGMQFAHNPRYLNSSLLDTIGSFKSYYLITHRNLNLYSYIKWDEKRIIHELLNTYDWETDPGTRTTWRIGDGTAAFYNYIYYTVAGFSEIDTFRSNQIREGDLTRQEALDLSTVENRPRWDSMQWYFSTVGLDFTSTVETIDRIRRRY
jgi:glutamine---fructose-6-phosphate transaminase (isomerizing)